MVSRVGQLEKNQEVVVFFCKELWFGHSRNLAWTVMYVYLAIYFLFFKVMRPSNKIVEK